MQPLTLVSREEDHRRARESPQKPREGIGRDGPFVHLELAVAAGQQPGRHRSRGAGGVHALNRLWRWRCSLRRRRKNAPYGIPKRADLLQVGESEGAAAEALPFQGKPPTEITRGPEQVHFLALAHHHHRVREIDGKWFPEPAKDRAPAPCRPEPLPLTLLACLHRL